jgi:hypothetical protein
MTNTKQPLNHIEIVLTVPTSTSLIKQTTKEGKISYHLQTDLKDQEGNLIQITRAYANIAKLEALEYCHNLDLNSLKFNFDKDNEQ